MNETSIRSEMKKMLYDLFDAGFDKNEILDIMSQGTRGLRGAQGNEEKSLIESLANGNGISVKEFVKYCKENRKSMGLALKEAVEKEQDMIKPQPAPAEEEHSEDGQPAPAEEEHVEEEQPAPAEEEHVEEEQPAPAEEEHREEEQPEPAEEEHSEEEQPPLIEEEHGEQKLSPKGKKLLAKVNELCVRIEKEKNPLKVYILKFQVRRLQARIQRELDLINIQESYAAKRADLKSNSAEKDGENVEEVAKLANQIYLKKQKLKSNSEFDYKSPDFLFDKETIQRQGGIENISKTLQESDKADVRDTGKRLEEMIRIRQELAKDEKDYKEKRAQLKNRQNEYDTKRKELDFEEKRLTVVKKYNVFSRIGDFFKNIGEGIKDILANREEMRQLKEDYKQAKAEAKLEAKAKDKALKQKYEDARKENTAKKNSEFLKGVKLTGKDLEKANSPVQAEEVSQEELEPIQEGAEPVVQEGQEL